MSDENSALDILAKYETAIMPAHWAREEEILRRMAAGVPTMVRVTVDEINIIPDDTLWVSDGTGAVKSWWFPRPYTERKPPTEEDKAIHRAISQSNGDGKRYGTGFFNE